MDHSQSTSLRIGGRGSQRKVTQGVGEAIQKWFHLLKILCTHFCFNLVFVPLYHMGMWYYNEQQKQLFQEDIGASDK